MSVRVKAGRSGRHDVGIASRGGVAAIGVERHVLPPLLVAAMLAVSGLVALAGLQAALAPRAAAAKVPKGASIPVVLAWSASTESLPLKGGKVTLSASVKFASSCSISVTPTFKGFTSARPLGCKSGGLRAVVSVPPQKAGVLLGFTLTAKGVGGTTDSSEAPVAVGFAPPPFVFSPHDLVLPVQAVGVSSSPQSVTVTNTSKLPAAIGALQLSGGDGFGDFQLNPGNCSGATLSAHQTCIFSVTFVPRESGDRNTFAQLSYQATVGKTVQTEALSMHLGGVAAFASVALSGPRVRKNILDFGDQGYQVMSNPPQQVELTNVGLVPLTIAGGSVVSGNTTDFSFQDSCGSASIDPGQSCLVTATFTPQQAGKRSALIALDDNTKSGSTTLELTGRGDFATTTLTGPGLAAAQPVGYSLGFGSSPVGVPARITLTIANTSPKGVILKFAGSTFSGTNPGDFGFAPGNCAGGGAEMVSGASCTFVVSFTPTLAVPRTATLTIQDNTSDLGEIINLSGTGANA